MKTKHLTTVAMYLALIILSGMIAIPMPVGVPVVLQNMMLFMAGGILGKKYGTLTAAVFVLAVALGLPVLPGGRGGAAVFFGISGSFFIGYVLAPFLVGLALEKYTKRNFLTFFIVYFLLGAVLINLTGLLSMSIHSGGIKPALVAMAGFLPIDTLKAAFAAWVSERIYATGKLNAFIGS